MTEPTWDLRCTHDAYCRGKGTYRLRVSCSNCGSTAIGMFTRGHEARTDECPVCDTRSVTPVSPRTVIAS